MPPRWLEHDMDPHALPRVLLLARAWALAEAVGEGAPAGGSLVLHHREPCSKAHGHRTEGVRGEAQHEHALGAVRRLLQGLLCVRNQVEAILLQGVWVHIRGQGPTPCPL